MSGVEDVRQMLRNLGRKGRGVVQKAQRRGANLVLSEARQRAPVVSGRYRKSLAVRALKRSRKRFGVRVTQKELQGDRVFYGSFLELGYRKRRKIPGRWLMRTAGQLREDEVVGLVAAEVKRLVEQEAQ